MTWYLNLSWIPGTESGFALMWGLENVDSIPVIFIISLDGNHNASMSSMSSTSSMNFTNSTVLLF